MFLSSAVILLCVLLAENARCQLPPEQTCVSPPVPGCAKCVEYQLPCTSELQTDIGQYVQEVFEQYEGQTPFLGNAGNATFVMCDLVARLNERSFCQARRNSCGETATAQIVAEYQPEEFANIVAEVYFTGKMERFKYTMSPYISELDFASASGMEPEGFGNIGLGSLLVFVNAVRDKRNQELAAYNESTVPQDGYDKIRSTDVAPEGSSYLSTAYDVEEYFRMFGYEASTVIGSNDTCGEDCIGPVKYFFPSDQAALSKMVPAYLRGEAIPGYTWSIRAEQFMSMNPSDIEQIKRNSFSRLSAQGFEYACEHLGPVVLVMNEGLFNGDTSMCNEQMCISEHIIVLDECTIPTNHCVITSWGALGAYPCDALANHTVAAVYASIPDNSQTESTPPPTLSPSRSRTPSEGGGQESRGRWKSSKNAKSDRAKAKVRQSAKAGKDQMKDNFFY